MNNHQIADGVWATMLTPFTEENQVDYPALGAMIDWYIENGVDGLFAVCQSSEMFFLSLEERVAVAQFVVKHANGRVGVVASGHISDDVADQIAEIKAISQTGIDAFVLVSNRLAKENESEAVCKQTIEQILQAVPQMAFGIYECPYPYKRLISPELLGWCAQTGRFLFLKDTSCRMDHIQAKLDAVQGSNLKLYNANSATLLDSLKAGAAGFSGVMANFHPGLYATLTQKWREQPELCGKIQDFLGVASMAEHLNYPVCAKYAMQLDGVPLTLATRSKKVEDFTPAMAQTMDQLCRHTKQLISSL